MGPRRIRITSLGACLLALGLGSCSSEPSNPLVGRWLTNRADLVDFTADGHFTQSRARNVLFTGTYRLVDAQTLEIQGESLFGRSSHSRLRITKQGNSLVLTPEEGGGEAETLVRAP